MKGFIKHNEYLLVEAITADYREFSEIYDTDWREIDAVKDLLNREDVIDEYIVEVKVQRCKQYYTKLHED